MKTKIAIIAGSLIMFSAQGFAASEMSKLTDQQCEELANVTQDVVNEFNRAKTVEDVKASYDALQVKYDGYVWFDSVVMFALQPPKLSAKDSHDTVLQHCLDEVHNGTVSI